MPEVIHLTHPEVKKCVTIGEYCLCMTCYLRLGNTVLKVCNIENMCPCHDDCSKKHCHEYKIDPKQEESEFEKLVRLSPDYKRDNEE